MPVLSLIPPGLQSECLSALLSANFKLSAFSKLADGNHAILLLYFLDWKRPMPLMHIPGSRNWLGFSFTGVRTLNYLLFESGG
jgi:hypothetical protein